jgi:hypothetical protein
LQISPFHDCRPQEEAKNAMPGRHGGAAVHAAFHLMGDSVSDSVRDRRRPGRKHSLRRGRIVCCNYAMRRPPCQAFAAIFPKDAQVRKHVWICEKFSQFVVIKTTGLGIENFS